MTTYYTSDLHFDHKNVIEYCKRPYTSVWQMNEALIQNWNTRVTPDDDVFIIGDFKMGDRATTKQFADRLNGDKHLIMGNHDRRRYCDEAFGFEAVTDFYEDQTFQGDNYLMIHDPAMVIDYLARPRHQRITPKFALVGHIHEKWAYQKINGVLCINVGVDVRNYSPVTLEELIHDIPEEMK